MPHYNRGITLHQQDDFAGAIAAYSEAIKADPSLVPAYLDRGSARWKQGDLDGAISDFTEAVRLSPHDGQAYGRRAIVWRDKGNYDAAIADLDAAIRRAPMYAPAYETRAAIRQKLGQYDKALEDFVQAGRLNLKSASALNGLAWLLATCPDERLRDGKRAVAAATRACELTSWTDAGTLDSLAAAYAETGDFKAAVQWQTRAVELAGEREKEESRSRLQLYEGGEPYREPGPSNP